MNKFIIKLDKFQQQVILASKGNSKLNDNFDKIFIIRNIIARYFKLRIKYISDKSVLKYLEELCEEIIKQNPLLNHELNYMRKNLFEYSSATSIIDIIENYISFLSTLKVKENGIEIIELDEDEEILDKLYVPGDEVDFPNTREEKRILAEKFKFMVNKYDEICINDKENIPIENVFKNVTEELEEYDALISEIASKYEISTDEVCDVIDFYSKILGRLNFDDRKKLK